MNTLDTPGSNSTTQPIWDTVLRYGGICAGAMVAFSLLAYLADINLMTGSGMLIIYGITLGIGFTMAALAMRHQRDKLDGGYISYGKALGIGVVVILIGMLGSSVWNYILINFIDPEYIGRLKDQFIESWGESMPQEALDKTLEAFDKSGTIYETLKNGILGGAIYGLIVGLITAAFVKREPKQTF